MRYLIRCTFPLSAVIVATPFLAGAQAMAQVVGFFNVFVGLMLTAALITYAIGVGMWATRLGSWPSYRTEAIVIMEWSVAILFVLVILLSIVQFFQNYPRIASYVFTTIFLLIVVVGIVIIATAKGKDEEKKQKKH